MKMTVSPEVAYIQKRYSRSVANVFIKLRKAAGCTSYEEFAYTHDFPRAQYWRVENGKANLTFRTLSKLLAIHNMKLDEFLQQVMEEYKRDEKNFKNGSGDLSDK